MDPNITDQMLGVYDRAFLAHVNNPKNDSEDLQSPRAAALSALCQDPEFRAEMALSITKHGLATFTDAAPGGEDLLEELDKFILLLKRVRNFYGEITEMMQARKAAEGEANQGN